MPRAEFERVMNETGGDLSKLDDLLSFGGTLRNSNPEDWDIAFISNPQVRMPTGNESGAFDNLWVPGGYTGGGVAEAVMDHPLDTNVDRCSYLEVLQHARCL